MSDTLVPGRERALRTGSVGTAVAFLVGVGAVLTGVLLLPWVTGSHTNGTDESVSLSKLRPALAKSGIQHWVIHNGMWVLVILVAAGVLGFGLALPERISRDRPGFDSQEWLLLAGFFGVGLAWAGDATYLASRLLGKISTEMTKSGITASIGIGAWVTLAGGAILVGAAISGAFTAARDDSEPASPLPRATATNDDGLAKNVAGHSKEARTSASSPMIATGRSLLAAFLQPGESLLLPDQGPIVVHSVEHEGDGSTTVWLRDGRLLTYPEGAHVRAQ